MKRYLRASLLFSILFLFQFGAGAQNKGLYIPLNIQKSIDKGVRSMDGKPGPAYWINHSDYNINAELFPDSSTLKGDENITYYNESPDTLHRIVIRLYQDIMKKGGSREFPIGDSPDLTDGVDLSLLVVGEDTIDVNTHRRSRNADFFRTGTNLIVDLKTPLPPKSSINISAKWSFHIPKIIKIRMGNYGDGEFFIAYWYPQIAVYDDIDGWDMIDYTGFVEFYNDFSNYNFNITLPDKYVVWAVGDLTNPEQVFKSDVLKKIEEAKHSDKVIKILTPNDYRNNDVTVRKGMNTWKFKAEKVADVSFCVSDSYRWDASSIEVGNNGRRVLASAVYEDSTIHFEEAAKFARKTIDYLSNVLPGYPYPYSHTTTFFNKQGGGGMETPMMANDGAPQDRGRSIEVISHEIAHTLMPFYMGTNERKYAWMDEGWASFFPTEIVEGYEPGYNYMEKEVSRYEKTAGDEDELPMITPSFSYKGSFAGIAFYQKPATFYYQLEDLLGRNLFKKCLLAYMDRWHNKHPLPIDFFNTFSNVSGKDLSWFIKPWFYEFGYPDLALEKAAQDGNNLKVTVKKIGNIPTSIRLTLLFKDGTENIINKKASEWMNGKNELQLNIKTDGMVKEVMLGGTDIPDNNRDNNKLIL